jgi:hypothetical protein
MDANCRNEEKRCCDSRLSHWSGPSKKGSRQQKVPFVSFKYSKIIRYHYAFDPNPDRLTKAFLGMLAAKLP